jgi:hypothetical protein
VGIKRYKRKRLVKWDEEIFKLILEKKTGLFKISTTAYSGN